MSWSGDFQIKYKGQSPKKFHKLAKMVIPNSLLRFNFDSCKMGDSSVELACTRNLSWYSADEDMKKLMSYFSDGDSISMEIVGEGDYEEIEISKNNGQVIFKNSNNTSERYTSSDIGITRMLYEEMSPHFSSEPEKIDICSIEGYIQLIANTFAGDEQLMPIVQDFIYTVLDKDKINLTKHRYEDKLSDNQCVKLDQMRSKFSSVESTSQFLNEYQNKDIKFQSEAKQDISDLPDWVQQYPTSIIISLGGPNLLKQMIDTKGEDKARKLIELLIIMSDIKEDALYNNLSCSFKRKTLYNHQKSLYKHRKY